MRPDLELETERLRLRRYRPEDLDDLHAMLSDAEHMRWYPAPLDREGTRAWMERTFERYRSEGFGLLIVEDRATGEFLGTAGPTIQVVEGVDEVEIGWHTRPDRRGRGSRRKRGRPPATGRSRTWTSTT